MGKNLFYFSISTAILIHFRFVLVLASSAFAIMSASTSAGHNVWDEDWEQQADVGPILCLYQFLNIHISLYRKHKC